MNRAVVVGMGLMVLACGGDIGPAVPSQTTAPPTTSPPSLPESSCREGQGGFLSDGPLGLLGSEEGDAGQVTALAWSSQPGCERLVVELSTEEGAPATRAGLLRGEVRRDLGLVRLELAEEVADTQVADAAFEGELMGGAFVVRSEDGSLHVDVHMAAPARARVAVLSSPARVVLDLRPGGPTLPAPPTMAERVVLLTPRGGGFTYPLDISGYARTFEANVVVRLRQGGQVRVERLTTASDWVHTWGEFAVVLPDGPSGSLQLFVGEESPQDGTEEGAVLELEA